METPGYAGTPLARLVLFMVCLSIAGSGVASVLYYTDSQSQQITPQAPENSIFPTDCATGIDACFAFCNAQGSGVAKNKCQRWCRSHC